MSVDLHMQDNTKKAQITLEYLLVSVVAIALLSISMYALIKIKENADKGEQILRFKATANELFSSIDELCALGSGNSMQVKLQIPINIASGTDNEKNIYFITLEMKRASMENINIADSSEDVSSIAHSTKCKVSVDGDFDNEIVLENKDGVIMNKK